MTTKTALRQRTAYLVLGMHRSGTSAVTQLLGLAGADLPQNLMPQDEHNAKGYFEPWRIATLNGERLHATGSAWDDPFCHPFRELPPAEERDWRKRALELFQEEYGDAAWPLLKDPRVTALLPLWRGVLDELKIGARCVISVRHPLAVAGSLERRDGFPTEKSLLVWTAYMLAAEAYTRDLPRAFVSYDALLADWRSEVARIERAHGAPLPKLDKGAARAIDGFLAPELRHNASAGGLADYGWAGALTEPVHAWFEAAARGEAPPSEALEPATAELLRRRDEIGMLVSPLSRDLDVARLQIGDLQRRIEIERRWAADRETDIRNVAAARAHEVRAAHEAELARVSGALDAVLAEPE